MGLLKRAAAWFAVCAFWPSLASGGLVVSAETTANGRTFGHFSGSGQYLGHGGPTDEELNSLTRGPDGDIYVLANTLGQGRVLRVSPTFTEIQSLNPFVWNGEFTVPSGLAFDPAGRVYAGSNVFRPGGGGFVD